MWDSQNPPPKRTRVNPVSDLGGIQVQVQRLPTPVRGRAGRLPPCLTLTWIAAVKSPFSKGGRSLLCFGGQSTDSRGLLGVTVFSREARWFLDVIFERRG